MQVSQTYSNPYITQTTAKAKNNNSANFENFANMLAEPKTIKNPNITQTTATSVVQQTNNITAISPLSQAIYTPPNQLSFEDYQSISFKDLDILYPSQTTVDANGYVTIISGDGSNDIRRQAVTLWQVANTFEDDTLGKTLFNQVNKDNPSEIDTLINNMIESASIFKMDALWERQCKAEDDYTVKMIIKNDPPYTVEKFAQYNGIYASEFKAKYPNDPAYITQEERDYANEHTRISSEKFFEMVDLSLNDTKHWGDPNKVHFSDTYKTQPIFIHIDEVMAEFSKLRGEYEQKLQELPNFQKEEVVA